jgi:phage-related baseplate assembly protein
VLISAGTRVTSQDGRIAYVTEETVTLAAGTTEVRTTVACETPGTGGNGWAIGQIAVLDQSPAAGMTTSNETVPAGGIDDEEDGPYIERIILAPESFSTAGPEGAYIYHARAAHQSIIDVAVRGGEADPAVPDGEVWIYPLTNAGLPSPELLSLVQANVSGRKKRPLTDKVLTKLSPEVGYAIRGSLTLYQDADEGSALALAEKAAADYAADRRAGLGRDIVPEQIIKAVQGAGVYRLQLTEPLFRDVASHEWANCTAIELTVTGVAHG